ncbi:hypothetical protein AAGW05_15860 [Arthrobacter sp. LAPM80]|uniref:hypothetical protein n=1 Tax=Arthrobacter sp. LAPM80 TaxID=3141788 RepID=UPI00398ABE22
MAAHRHRNRLGRLVVDQPALLYYYNETPVVWVLSLIFAAVAIARTLWILTSMREHLGTLPQAGATPTQPAVAVPLTYAPSSDAVEAAIAEAANPSTYRGHCRVRLPTRPGHPEDLKMPRLAYVARVVEWLQKKSSR